jgi:hypothetical protein
MTTDFQCEVQLDGISYLCDVTLELTPGDNGIGAYEYWGAKGYDRQPCWKLENLCFYAYDENGADITDTDHLQYDEKLCSKLEDKLTDKAWAIIDDMDLPSKGDH